MLASAVPRAGMAGASLCALGASRARALLPVPQALLHSWATADAEGDGMQCMNLVNGEWGLASASRAVPDPLTSAEAMVNVPHTSPAEIAPFVDSLKAVPKSGLHNPLKSPERYCMYGDITARVAAEFKKKEVEEYFARLIQRTSPKSWAQALGEVRVTGKFLDNFCGDQVRFLARGFSVSGDHMGQTSNGVRWPFGPVALITPFNFPLEIPVLQLMGALYMGNKPILHVDQRVSIVMDQYVRLLHECGMPKTDVDIFHGPGTTMNEILMQAQPRTTLFTGSQKVAEHLAVQLAGKVRLEDAGFDWKILGPDVDEFEYVSWQCDQDAYACSGQKCSAQSILFMHDAWAEAGLEAALRERASTRKLSDLTVGPVLSWTTEAMLGHVEKLLAIPGARVMFGGKPLTDHTIPEIYGAIEPTAVFVPLDQLMKPEYFGLCTTEVFGPLQVVTQYSDGQLDAVLECCERMTNHLTAAVVSDDIKFIQKVLGSTVNGTTYAGRRARTTGAPQNHWFGPAGDPRGAGIGTPEAIQLVWSTHREIINDFGPCSDAAALVQS